MPRCEGRSIETGVTLPCPDKKSDTSVRLSQGDLMLCPACSEFRFSTGKPAAAKDTGRTRSTKNAEKSAVTANPTLQLAELMEVIANQNVTIKTLSDKLNFVLSYLEIESTVSGTSQLAGNPDPLSKTGSSPASQATYASITARLAAEPTRHQAAAVLSKDVVAAVYVDMAEKNKRESNIIVSGLQPSLTETDIQLVLNLCSTELGTQPDVVHAKRLGRKLIGKTQPLLVVLRDADEAKKLIRNARYLRHSTNSVVKKDVYINPNLTAAEAAAAYQLRVQRRSSAQRRRENGGYDGDVPAERFSENLQQVQPVSRMPAALLEEDIRKQSAESSLQSGINSLNPGAGLFIPTVSVKNHFQVLGMSESVESTVK